MATTAVSWNKGERRRAKLEAELGRILTRLPQLGVVKAIVFGSMASGRVGSTSDLDLILVAPSSEPFVRRLERFYRTLEPSVGLDLFVYTPEEFARMAETNSFVQIGRAHV